MRLLVMYSWDDDISQRRWLWIQSSPALRDFTVAQCFALDSEESIPHAEAIFARISSAIAETTPDVFLIHTGAAYHRAPAEFAECVCRIKAAYPTLRIGYERREHGVESLEKTGAFDTSESMRKIEEAFFGRGRP